MMRRSRTLAGIGSVLFSLGALLCGCGKEQPQTAAPLPEAKPALPAVPGLKIQLPADLGALKAETEKGLSQVDTVLASLDATCAAADGDPRPAFKKFQTDLAALNSQAATIRTRADAMKSKGAAYFKTWEEQLAAISTPEIKAAAAARKDELAKHYDAILADMAKAREGYDKFAGYLGDVSKVMENDLNAAGLKALAPKVTEAKAKSAEAKANVTALLGQIEKIAAIYSPGK